MADVNAEIGVSINTSGALAQLKALQREIARFHTSVAKSSEAASLAQRDLQRNFLNGVNAIQGFSAELRTVRTTAENFTDSLDRNKFSMREYFRYSAASTKTFGRLFRSELDTVNKVAEENVKRLQTQYIKMGRDAQGVMRAIAVMPTQLDYKNLTTQTQIAAQKQAIFNQLVKQGSTNLLNFGKNTQWAGRQLMVGFTIPLIGLGSVATKTFMDMETAAIKFRKVYGDLFTPTVERERAFEDVQNLGREFTKYGIAVAETVSLAADAAAAGFKGLDLQRQVTEATRLQVLGQIDQQKALETTISLQNAFRLSSADLAESINFLNAVENQTVVSLDDITTAIPKAAPIIRELGGDVKDLAFFMAAMKEGGINASEGANALKSGLASLINPSDKARGMLADFGIDIDAIVNKNAGNVKQTVVEFAMELDNLSSLSRQRAIEQLFGKFQQARLSALFDNVIRDGNQASRVLELAGTSTEELASLAESELGITANSAMNKFRKSVEDLRASLAPVGQLFLEIVTPFLENIGDILERFNNLSAGTKRVIATLVVGLGAIAPVVLMTVGLFANFVANGIKGLMLLRNGYLRLTGQSQILSEQTNYLSREQQQALAAAASLEQSHMRLEQVFTGETTALRLLIQEYQRMIAAQNAAAATFPGMMVPGFRPKGYANGIISVPGPKGAGDIIPAMVSPGEAIIPAKLNAKYAPLVQGIIADNIPGFKKGTKGETPSGSFSKSFSELYGDTGRLYAAPPQILKQTETKMWSTLDAEKQAVLENTKQYLDTLGLSAKQVEEKLANLTRVQASHIEKQTFETSIGGEQRSVKEWSSGNLQADLGAINNFLNVVPKISKTLDDSKISEISARLDISVDEFKQELSQLEEGLHPTTQKAANVLLEVAKEGAGVDPSLETSKSKREALEKLKYQSIAAKSALEVRQPGDYYSTLPERAYDPSKDFASMQDINLRVSKVRQELLASFNVSEEVAQLSGQNVQALQNAWNQLSIEQQEGLLRLKGNVPEFTAALLEEAKNAGIAGFEVGNNAIKGIAKGTAAASPSEKAKQQGRNVVDGFEQGILEGMDDAALAAAKVNDIAVDALGAQIPGATIQNPNIIQSQQVLSSGSVIESVDEFGNSVYSAAENTKTASVGISKWNGKLMGASFALSSITGVASLFGNNLGGLGDKIFKVSSAMFALQGVVQALTQTQLLNLAANRLALAKQATAFATYGTGAASRAGVIGLLGRVGVFARTLLGLTNPIGATIAILTTGVALYKIVNDRLEANERKINALGDAALAAGKALEGIESYFGVNLQDFVFETFENRQTVAGDLAATQRQKVEDFIASDDFKKLKDVVDGLRGATTKQAKTVLEGLAIQLEAKGLGKDQVRVVIDALKQEARQTEVEIDFKAIDISTKAGRKQLEKSVTSLISVYNKKFNKGINDSYQKTLNLTAKSLIGNLGALQLQFAKGAMDAKEYVTQINNINASILAIPNANAKMNLVNAMLATMGKKARDAAAGVKDLSNKLLLIQAINVGAIQPDDPLIKMLQSPIWAERVLAQTKIAEKFKSTVDAIMGSVSEYSDTSSDADKNAGDGKSLQKELIKIYNKQIEALEKKKKALQDVNDEIDRNNQYLQDQMDLSNQISEAKISGNYLEAAALTQQQLMRQSEFRRETQEIDIQRKIDAISERISQLENNAKITEAERKLLKLEGANKNTTPKGNGKNKQGSSSGSKSSGSAASKGDGSKGNKKPTSDTPDLKYQDPNDKKDPYKDLPQYNLRTIKYGKHSFVGQVGFNNAAGTKNVRLGFGFKDQDGKPHRIINLYGDGIRDKKGGMPLEAPNTARMPVHALQRLAYGGQVKNFVSGGDVNGPGTTRSDSIPAMLSDGEYVINAGSVNKYGVELFEALNAKKFKNGGIANSLSKIPSSSPSAAFSGIRKLAMAITDRNTYLPKPGDKTGLFENSGSMVSGTYAKKKYTDTIGLNVITGSKDKKTIDYNLEQVKKAAEELTKATGVKFAIGPADKNYNLYFGKDSGMPQSMLDEWQKKPALGFSSGENLGFINAKKINLLNLDPNAAKKTIIHELIHSVAQNSAETGGSHTLNPFNIMFPALLPGLKTSISKSDIRAIRELAGYYRIDLPNGNWTNPEWASPKYPKLALGGYVNMASLPKFKNGIDNVPYDMPAILHKNERVLTAEENKRYGETNSTINATFNITGGNSDEIVNKVMVKLNNLNNKNNKSNRVNI